MCSLAPVAALGFDPTLDGRCGVSMACGAMARAGQVGGKASSTQKRAGHGSQVPVAPAVGGKASSTQKRGRDDGAEAPVAPVLEQQRLQQRMRAEAEAMRDLHKKALSLCRGSGVSGARRAREAQAPLEAAAKRRKTSASKRTAETRHQAKEPEKQRPVHVQGSAPPTPVRSAVNRDMEITKARARSRCRQELLEMERTALPDETIYPQDLEELGIWDEYVVTRTRKQACSRGP